MDKQKHPRYAKKQIKPLLPIVESTGQTPVITQEDAPKGGPYTFEYQTYQAGQIYKGLWKAKSSKSRLIRLVMAMVGLFYLALALVVVLLTFKTDTSGWLIGVALLGLIALFGVILGRLALKK